MTKKQIARAMVPVRLTLTQKVSHTVRLALIPVGQLLRSLDSPAVAKHRKTWQSLPCFSGLVTMSAIAQHQCDNVMSVFDWACIGSLVATIAALMVAMLAIGWCNLRKPQNREDW